MNLDTTNNPYRFKTDNPNAFEPSEAGKIKPFTKAVFIIHLIFGALGIIGFLGNALSIMFRPQIEKMMVEIDANQKLDLNPFPGAFPAMVSLTIVSGVLSIAMVWGGIAGLKRKLLGVTLIKMSSMALIFYKLFEMPYTTAMTYFSFPDFKRQMIESMSKEADGVDIGAFLDVVLYVSIGFGVLIAIGLMIFYALCYMHLSKAEVRANFR
jgi:hypothetical protein